LKTPIEIQSDIFAMFTSNNEVDQLAIVLMQAWGKAEPQSSISQNPASYVATFVDMAKAIVEHQKPTISDEQVKSLLDLKESIMTEVRAELAANKHKRAADKDDLIETVMRAIRAHAPEPVDIEKDLYKKCPANDVAQGMNYVMARRHQAEVVLRELGLLG